MSLSKLSKLPPEVLSCVLNNQAIPLSHRLHLRLLCNRWADIIEDALKKETSLMVRDEMAYYLKPKPDDLLIKSSNLTDAFTRPLSRLFTSLTQLTLNFAIEASGNAVPSLLAHLNTTNLSTVKLYAGMFNCGQIDVIAIADALSALSGVTSLTLRGYRLGRLLLPHLKPVMSRLEKLSCLAGTHGLADILSTSLSPRLTHLQLPSHVFQSFNSPFLVELSRNLTHLQLLACANTIWQSITQMNGLSSLSLDFTRDPHLDSSLFSHFGPFTHLTDVKLYSLQYRAPLALPSKKESPFATVKRLTLGMLIHFQQVNYPAFFQAISAWFPALAHLTIIVDRDIISDIQASLGKLPFSVEIENRDSVDTCSADW